jgi:2-haloacid dehalogenase
VTERWLSFDCYGTLIDWEGGIADALAPLLPGEVDRDALAKRYIEVEAGIESDHYVTYREILDRAGRALLREHGVEARSPLPGSLASWRPFPEVPAALRELRASGYKLAILSNVDRDLLDHSIVNLGVAPDVAVTAQDCGSYKPAPGHWEHFLRDARVTPQDVIHVGASQYHDMRPAAALGFRTVFVDRHGEDLVTAPTRVIPDLSTLPEVVAQLG